MNKKPSEKVRKVRIESYIAKAEHEKVVLLAQQCGISVSELIHRLALGQDLKMPRNEATNVTTSNSVN